MTKEVPAENPDLEVGNNDGEPEVVNSVDEVQPEDNKVVASYDDLSEEDQKAADPNTSYGEGTVEEWLDEVTPESPAPAGEGEDLEPANGPEGSDEPVEIPGTEDEDGENPSKLLRAGKGEDNDLRKA